MVTLYAVLTLLAGALLENFFILKTTHYSWAMSTLLCSLVLSLITSVLLINKAGRVPKKEHYSVDENISGYSALASIIITLLSLICTFSSIIHC
jgi:hypothetical protein